MLSRFRVAADEQLKGADRRRRLRAQVSPRSAQPFPGTEYARDPESGFWNVFVAGSAGCSRRLPSVEDGQP